MNLDVDRFLNLYSAGGIALIGLIAITVAVSGSNRAVNAADQTAIKDVQAVVYKSPSCGCCGAWAQYAERRGINVEVNAVGNLNQIKEKYGVPEGKQACHTTVLKESGYVVEGHVPTRAINKLLTEKPDVQGIGLPGMPKGSPGMPGPKQGDWKIYSFTESSQTSKFMTV
ncbi:hypothetical protein GKQ38_02525 [Candidatus Nanohaloarchaea archaeon]|nr:hypothetical protein GKQ38_02525 [Candidatus Nanohaloarchaea archaeon]